MGSSFSWCSYTQRRHIEGPVTHLDSSHHVGLLTVRRAAGMCRRAAAPAAEGGIRAAVALVSCWGSLDDALVRVMSPEGARGPLSGVAEGSSANWLGVQPSVSRM